jgi:hypothetical protein
VRTHPVDKLLEQHCYKSAAGLSNIRTKFVTSSLVGTNFNSNSATSEFNSEMSLLSMCCLMCFGEKPILRFAITKQNYTR